MTSESVRQVVELKFIHGVLHQKTAALHFFPGRGLVYQDPSEWEGVPASDGCDDYGCYKSLVTGEYDFE